MKHYTINRTLQGEGNMFNESKTSKTLTRTCSIHPSLKMYVPDRSEAGDNIAATVAAVHESIAI